jgi:murein L,D-transpeptidase YcbB/YkuD
MERRHLVGMTMRPLRHAATILGILGTLSVESVAAQDAAIRAVAVLRAADEHGLEPNDYAVTVLDSLAAVDRTRFDVMLVASLTRYVEDLRFGRVRPAPLSRTLPAARLDLATAVADALAGDSVAALVEAVAPPFAQYRHLRRALAHLRVEAARDSSLVPRVRQIELALERLRWLPPLGQQRVLVVNIPAFELFAFDSIGGEGIPALQMKVIVGKALDTRTPVLVEQMRTVEFRPYWNVPRSILVNELLPALRRNPQYLRKNDMELVAARDRVVGDAVTVEVLRQLATGALRVRQRPTPKNALGPVKFVFPNAANIYLHGTPQPRLFARTRRDFSHGCIRVEDPAALAAWVLRDQPTWPIDSVRAAMAGPRTRRVPLTRPIPVIAFYTTAVVAPGDSIVFYNDIYGHDRRLDAALRATRLPLDGHTGSSDSRRRAPAPS